MQQCQAKEAWLVGERRALGERKYYLSNLPPAETEFRFNCETPGQQLQTLER